MFDAGSNGICQSVLIVNVLIFAVYVSFEFIHKLGECPLTFFHWFPKGWKVAHLGNRMQLLLQLHFLTLPLALPTNCI